MKGINKTTLCGNLLFEERKGRNFPIPVGLGVDVLVPECTFVCQM